MSVQEANDPLVVNGWTYSTLRTARQARAKLKGTHTKLEWTALFDVFGACVGCGVPYSDLYGGYPCKDHIEPIRWEWLRDCIANIQPVCRNCNSRGLPGDMRNIAAPRRWVKHYIALLGKWDGLNEPSRKELDQVSTFQRSSAAVDQALP